MDSTPNLSDFGISPNGPLANMEPDHAVWGEGPANGAFGSVLSPPAEPQSLEFAGLSSSEVESLVLKVLLHQGNSTGSSMAEVVCLPRTIVLSTLDTLRDALLVTIKSSQGVHDYVYQLTDAGFERAQRHAARSNYVGAAPVPFEQYLQAVQRQSLQNTRIELNQLCQAMSDLLLQPGQISQIGQALNDGRGLFLYGAPGNGKTSIAERVCNAFGQSIWIPKLISFHGETLQLFDQSCHQAVESSQLSHLQYDRRWVLIQRPTIVVGGELTLDYLEPRFRAASGVSEAPVQLKANCGTLVIDDFGRQRASCDEILNRLIVPLEKQYDFLYLTSGRQVQVPFDLLLVLSTNLEPHDLLDEAFLRRIPYKLEIGDPTEAEFRKLLAQQAVTMNFEWDDAAVDHLMEQHYRRTHRPYRFCHPRDLLRQLNNFCEVHGHKKRLTSEGFDVAIQNYFSGL